MGLAEGISASLRGAQLMSTSLAHGGARLPCRDCHMGQNKLS